MPSSLTEKLELIRLANTPHKLSTFVKLYTYHRHIMYIDYMYNAKVMLDFLTDSGRIPLDLEDARFTNTDDKLMLKASMIGSYTISQMASMIADNMGEKYNFSLHSKIATRICVIIMEL